MDEVSVVDVLLLAKDQIAEEGHWCQGNDRSTHRQLKFKPITVSMVTEVDPAMSTPYEVEEVVSFCMRGAVREAARQLTSEWGAYGGLYTPAIQALARGVIGGNGLRGFLTSERIVVSTNDLTSFTQQDALDTFDRAIAIEKNKTH